MPNDNMRRSHFLLLFISTISSCTAPTLPPSVCQTRRCYDNALKLLEYMDRSVNPCDDFYQFACGGYLQEKIPDHLAVRMFTTDGSLSIDRQLRQLIQLPIRQREPKPFKLVKTFYRSCMNRTAIGLFGVKDLRGIFDIVGGWPVLKGDDWKDSEVTWEEVSVKINRLGYKMAKVLVNVYIGTDLKNSTKSVIFLDEPANIMQRDTSKKMVKLYYEYMIDIAVHFGANKARARKELLEVVNFELQLSGISADAQKKANLQSNYNMITVRELADRTQFDWLGFINNLWAPYVKLNKDERVVVLLMRYWEKFVPLLQKTPKRTIINYILWKVVVGSISYLPNDLRQKEFQFISQFSGETARPPRWQECVQLCSSSLNIAASSMHIRKHYSKSMEKGISEMLENIRTNFYYDLRNAKWIDDSTKQQALEKLRKMMLHIGPPQELTNNYKLSRLYEGLTLYENHFLRSMLAINIFNERIQLEQYRKPVNKSDWTDHSDSLTVDAYYKFQENSMQIPAGILREPMYNRDNPKYMNYGGLGFVLGHELNHAFDDQGKQFNKYGDLHDWWQEDTSKAFTKKAQCFIDYYNNFTVDEVGLNVDGGATLGENIADHGGLRHSYASYLKYLKKNGPEEWLPRLNYNNRQMFWLAAAHCWCASFRLQEMKGFVLGDAHAPPKFRILGAFSNLQEFSRDFKCGESARMNPRKKCQMW